MATPLASYQRILRQRERELCVGPLYRNPPYRYVPEKCVKIRSAPKIRTRYKTGDAEIVRKWLSETGGYPNDIIQSVPLRYRVQALKSLPDYMETAVRELNNENAKKKIPRCP